MQSLNEENPTCKRVIKQCNSTTTPNLFASVKNCIATVRVVYLCKEANYARGNNITELIS